MKLAVFLLSSVCLPFVVAAQPDPPTGSGRVLPNMTDGVHQEAPIIFTYVDEDRRRRLTLDLYRPESLPAEGELGRPAIVMYFGGGWQNGRPGLFGPLAQALAQRGYVCVVPEYRLSGEAPFPAAVHDAKAAIRWTRKNAKRFGIDPKRIACIGGSAGGHLAGFMGASNGVERFEGAGDHQEASSEVQAAIIMCGPMYMLTDAIVERVEAGAKRGEGETILDFMGGVPPSQDRDRYVEASPLTHLNENSPPMLFIDGENDRPRLRYTEFWAKMDELGIEHEFILMPDGPHPFWNLHRWFKPTVDAVDQFLLEQLP
ncbi:MAG: alpha/beta hydrolase [Verrucomicrobiota bacterium]